MYEPKEHRRRFGSRFLCSKCQLGVSSTVERLRFEDCMAKWMLSTTAFQNVVSKLAPSSMAQSTWPALCAVLHQTETSLREQRKLSSLISRVSIFSFSSNHRRGPLILPKFYRLKDLIGVGGCCSDSVGSTTFGSFQGAGSTLSP